MMNTTNNAITEVGNYNLTASNGKHIRVATFVRFADGRTIKFMEKMSKREAAKQAANTCPRCLLIGTHGVGCPNV